MDFVAIDFETANNSPTSMCAVGIAVVQNGELVHSFARLVKPTPNYYAHTRIHGIDERMTATAPSFAALWPQLQEMLQGMPLVAHNASFDRNVLASTLRAYHLPAHEAPWYCSVQISRRVMSHLPNHKLSSVCQALGIPLNHHEAESDARGCAHIMLHAMQQTGATSLPELQLAASKLPAKTFGPRR